MAKTSKNWEKEMEEEATKETAREKARSGGGGSQNLSIKNRRFTFGGENLGRELECVIIDFTYSKTLYIDKFKEGEKSIPACFALSEDGEDMSPHDNASKPQADACEGCPKNEWGSSGRGRGKACQDRRRLGLIHIDDAGSADDIAEANVVMLNVPPASIKNWSAYIDEVKKTQSRPYFAVVTKMSFDMDADFPTLMFEFVDKVDKDIYDAVKERRAEVRDMLMVPFESPNKADKDEDDEEDDEDGDDRDSKASRGHKRSGKGSKGDKKFGRGSKSSKKGDEDSDDEDEEDEEDDDKPAKKAKSFGKGSKKSSKDKDKDDDEDEDKGDEEDDEEEPVKKSKASKKAKAEEEDEDEDDEEDEKPKKKKSRFG